MSKNVFDSLTHSMMYQYILPSICVNRVCQHCMNFSVYLSIRWFTQWISTLSDKDQTMSTYATIWPIYLTNWLTNNFHATWDIKVLFVAQKNYFAQMIYFANFKHTFRNYVSRLWNALNEWMYQCNTSNHNQVGILLNFVESNKWS